MVDNSPSVTTEPPSEREKWEADLRFREREVAAREHEVAAKVAEQKRWWTNPLFLAVIAALAAIIGNAVVARMNGKAQRKLEGPVLSAS
jgi:hypothetical protein